METRALLKEEKVKIFNLHENPFKFKLGDFLWRSIVVLLLLGTIASCLKNCLGNLGFINVKFITIASFLTGFVLSLVKFKNRKKLFKEAFSSNTAVEIYFFEINRYAQTPMYKSEYTAYICELPTGKTLQFLSDSDLGNSLNKHLKIEVIQLEAPLVLKISNSLPKEKAIKVKATKFLTNFMEEIADYEFSIHDEEFDAYFE